MSDLTKDLNVNCEEFVEELEGLAADGPGGATREELLAALPEQMRAHRARCASCSDALQDLADTRRALGAMKGELPVPGPWFTGRLMATIAAREEEIEEKKEGVWVSVRRLAPRLVAFAALLLVLGGSWAIEERRAERSKGPVMRPAESLFEGSPSAATNDDVVAGIYYQEQVP